MQANAMPDVLPADRVVEMDLRDFPADVQDLLRTRAIRERRPVGEIIAAYALEVARTLNARADDAA